MKSVSAFLCGVLLSAVTIFAQSPFTRNDGYDFAGDHYLKAGGNTPDDFNIFIESNSDFRRFKLHIIKSRLTLGPRAICNRYRVDMNNDGSWEQGWTNSNEITVSSYYPNPPDGVSANHTIKVEIEYMDYDGQTYPPKTKYNQITIFSTPRVYVDSENNSFIQLRDEDCTAKIPVLMVEGFDPPNEKFPEVYYNLTWDLVNTDLYPNGYEVFILNFHEGGRDLRPNADVLMKAIEKVYEICPNYKIVLAGLSMGGPIARYALAKREGQGGTHNVGLFLSYDSPQYWAHVNPGLQDWIASRDPGEGAIGLMQANLQSVGAKQMLGYNTYDPTHIFRDQFYNELNALNSDGYPHRSYNVSVSNGNFNATWGNTSIGRHLLTLKINDELIHDVAAVEFDCETGSMISDITTKRYGDIFNNPLIHVYYEMQIIFNPAYTPTWSSLDLVDWNDNAFGDIISFDRSKFDDYVVQTTPLQHHELSTITRNKIMQWLTLNFNITVNYELPAGGSIDPDIYQVRILHGVPITVQPRTLIVNGQEVVYYFSHWEDGDTHNPRTFYSSHDVSHTVMMNPLVAPANVQADGHPSHVFLSWDAVPNAQTYGVYRSNSPEGPFTAVATTANLSAWDMVSGAPATYFYRVNARASGYEGPSSATVSAEVFHLQSQSVTSLASNSQRKFTLSTRDPGPHNPPLSPLEQLVFESGNECWITRKPTDENNWSAEIRLSDGTGTSSAPSISS